MSWSIIRRVKQRKLLNLASALMEKSIDTYTNLVLKYLGKFLLQRPRRRKENNITILESELLISVVMHKTIFGILV
jgi:hypothetical protein